MIPQGTSAQWCADLDHLAGALRREHRDLFHSVSRARFDAAVRSLRARIPVLEGHEVVVELARLVALVGDGHTRLPLADVSGFRRYPLRLYQYADGLFVQAIAREHGAAAGARLLAIGDTPAPDAYEAMRALISHDNEMGVRAAAPELLTLPEVLHARGVLSDPERAAYVVQRPSGERLTCVLHPANAPLAELADACDGVATPPPLWLQQSPERNWSTPLADTRTLYVQYNRVRDTDEESVASFFDGVFAHIEREDVRRLILDIRLNAGGNMSLNRPLIHHLIRCDAVNHWGQLFVIIGRHTFSAAMNLAVDLERHTRALFVGEPTGGRPNHYGENADIILPHSGLRCTASALWWQHSSPRDDRPWIAPDIPAALWSADYAANRDPALEAIMRYRPEPTHPVEDRHAPDYLDKKRR
jgi:hypothetical protein